MKAKVYPLSSQKNIKMEIPPSAKMLHYAIICASIAKGTSVLKNVNYNRNILDTIQWCKQMGATIKQEKNRLTIHGVNNQIHLTNNVFETKASRYTFLYMLPLLSLSHHPIIFKTPSSAIIEQANPYKYIFEKENLYYHVENQTIKIEQAIKSGFIYINGHDNASLILGLLLALPLLNTGSKIVVRAPVTEKEDIEQFINLLKKFGIHIIFNTSNHTIEIMPNQSFKAYSFNIETDYYLLSLCTVLNRFSGVVNFIHVNKKSSGTDYLLLQQLKEFNIEWNNRFLNPKKRKELHLTKVDVSIYKKVFPLLLVLALFNKNAVTFTHLDSSSTIQRQLKIMLNVFDVLEVEYQQQENELLVFPKQIQNKKQLDCQKDPYIAIVLSLLAVISKAPLIIKNCQCINYVFEGFYRQIQNFGSIVEFIHD